MKLCLRCNQYFQDALGACPEDNTPLEPVGENPLIGALLSDRYVVESVIGKGSSGIVYKARRMERGEMVVAVKVLHSYLGADSGSLDRFLREARAASRLRNPHIITIWDTGVTDDGQPFFVMDYLEGGTLADVIAEKGYLPPGRALPIVKQICDALTEAHKQGIVHRDLKPENVVLQETDQGDDYVKLLDFGIADSPQDQIKQKLEKVKTVSGSPAYMSPEQCQGFELDPRSDIYSLGIVVFEMLAGQRPFKAAEHMSLMFLHVSKAPFKLAEIRSDVKYPPALEAMLAKALAKKPGQRQQTIKEFWTELENSIRDTEYGSALAVKRQVSVQADAFSVPEFDRLTPADTGSYGSQQSGWGFTDQSEAPLRSVISSPSKEVSPPPAIAPAASSQDNQNFTPGEPKYVRPNKESNGSSVKKKRDTTGTGSGSFAIRSTGLRGVKSYGSNSFQGLGGLGFESSLAPSTSEAANSISNSASTKPSLTDWASGSLTPASTPPALPSNGGDSKSGGTPGNGHSASNGGNGASKISSEYSPKNGAEAQAAPAPSSSPSAFLAHANEAVAQSAGPTDAPAKVSGFKVPPPANQITEAKAANQVGDAVVQPPAPGTPATLSGKPVDTSSVVPASILDQIGAKPEATPPPAAPPNAPNSDRKPMSKTKQDAASAQTPSEADTAAKSAPPEATSPAPLLRAPTSFLKPNAAVPAAAKSDPANLAPADPASAKPPTANQEPATNVDAPAASAMARSSSSPFKRFAKTEVDVKVPVEGAKNEAAADVVTEPKISEPSPAEESKTEISAVSPTENLSAAAAAITASPVIEPVLETALETVKETTSESPTASEISSAAKTDSEISADVSIAIPSQGFPVDAPKSESSPANETSDDDAKSSSPSPTKPISNQTDSADDALPTVDAIIAASIDATPLAPAPSSPEKKSESIAAKDETTPAAIESTPAAPLSATHQPSSVSQAAAQAMGAAWAPKPASPAQGGPAKALPTGITSQLRPNSQPGAKAAPQVAKSEAGAETLKMNANDVAQVRKAHAQIEPAAPTSPAANLPSAAATNSANNPVDFSDLAVRHPTGFVPAYSKPPSKEWEIRKPGERRAQQSSQNSIPVEKSSPAAAPKDVKAEPTLPAKGIFGQTQQQQSQSGNHAAPSQEALSGLFMDFTQQAKQAKNAASISSSNLASNAPELGVTPPVVPPQSQSIPESKFGSSQPEAKEEKKEILPTPSLFDLDVIATKSLSDFHSELLRSGDSIPSLKKKSDVATQSINLDPDFLNSSTPLLNNEERLGQLKASSGISGETESIKDIVENKESQSARESADKLIAEEHEKAEKAAEESRKQIEQEKIVSEKIKSAQVKADQMRAEQQKAEQEKKEEILRKAKAEADEAEKARAAEAAEKEAEEALKVDEETAALEAKQAAELERHFKETQAKELQALAKERREAAEKVRKQEEEKTRQAKARKDEEASKALEEIAERERKANELKRLAEEEEAKAAAQPYVDPAAPKTGTEIPVAQSSDSETKLPKSQTSEIKPANSAVSRLIEAAKKAQSTKTSMEVYSDERLTAPATTPPQDSAIPNQFFTDFDSSFNKPAGKPSSAATTRSVDNFPTGQHNRLGAGQASQEPLSPNDYGLNVKDSQFLPKYTDSKSPVAGRQPSSIAPSPGQMDTGNIPQPTFGGDNARSVADLVEAKRLANEQRLALTARPSQEEDEPEDLQSFVKQKYEAALKGIRGEGHKTQQKQKAQKSMNATRNRTAALRSRPNGFGALQFFLVALVIFLVGMASLIGWTTYQDMNSKRFASGGNYQALMDKKDFIQVVKILEKKEEQINLSEKELKDLNAAYYGAAKQAKDSKHYADGIAFLNKLSERAPKSPDADKLMRKLKKLQGKR